MVIRHAEMADLPAMMDMFARARAFMASSGNPNQWVDGYPSAAQFAPICYHPPAGIVWH